MSSRRDFLKNLFAGAGTLAITATMPGLARALTGPAQSTGTWNALSDANIWTQAWANRFTNQLPNPLDPALLGIGFIYRPDALNPATPTAAANSYTITAGQTNWNVLGIPGVQTPVWGYGNWEGGSAIPVTFPGRSFVVNRNAPIQVNWINNLVDANGNALPHLLPIDQTLPLANIATGVPIAVHHHGGDTAAEFDGGPDQWQTPKRVESGPAVITGGVGANATSAGSMGYTYDNVEEASMTWYHDHAEGVTRLNAYAGLAGLYVVRDANEAALIAANSIPSGDKELALVLQDRSFAADGSMAFSADPAQYPVPLAGPMALPAGNPTHMPEMFGDIITVNGVAWPNYDVEPAQYRVRLLNGSDARFYTLTFGTAGVWQIGTDMGFLNRPVPVMNVTIGPGERIDLVVDFAALNGTAVVVTNSAPTPFPAGAPVAVGSGPDVVMRFNVVKPAATITTVTPRGRTRVVKAPTANIARTRALRGLDAATPVLPAATVPAGATVRRILLGEGMDEYGRITPMLGTYDPTGVNNLGTLNFNDPATETPALGSTEVWEFWNTTVDSHPVHIHLVKFRVLNRQAFTGLLTPTVMANNWQGVQLSGATLTGRRATPAPATEQGWKDTVVCPPGMVTRVVMNFNRPGKYVYHCHILSHEEHDMMRWFVVA
jgi:spore coat protein A